MHLTGLSDGIDSDEFGSNKLDSSASAIEISVGLVWAFLWYF